MGKKTAYDMIAPHKHTPRGQIDPRYPFLRKQYTEEIEKKKVLPSDLVGLADHWIGFGWIGFGWTGSRRFIALDWIGLTGLEAPGAPMVIPY
jgi:hypothetical protein